jgi:hypothetical protein
LGFPTGYTYTPSGAQLLHHINGPFGGQQGGQEENLLVELHSPSHGTATTGADRGTQGKEAMASMQRMGATAVELFFNLVYGIGH